LVQVRHGGGSIAEGQPGRTRTGGPLATVSTSAYNVP
jgi:hypothetical protein